MNPACSVILHASRRHLAYLQLPVPTVQDNKGRTWGFGIPSITFFVTLMIFLAGTPFYRHKKPNGSAITRIVQVLVSAARKRSAVHPADSRVLYDISDKDPAALKGRKLLHTHAFRCTHHPTPSAKCTLECQQGLSPHMKLANECSPSSVPLELAGSWTRPLW